MDVHGGNIYDKSIRLDFSVNGNPLGMPAGVKRALQMAVEDCTAYPQLRSEELCRALSEKEGVAAECIVCGNGASELIMAVAGLFAGQRVLLEEPIFSAYERAFTIMGCELCHAMPAEGLQRSEELFALIGALRPALVVFCNPANPTGLLAEREWMRRLGEACAKNGCCVLADETFLEFAEGEESAAACMGEGLQLFRIKAFTKFYAMPGVRLGYALCPDEGMAQRLWERLPEWNVSLLAQRSGLAALREKEYAQRSISFTREERKFLSDGLQSLGKKVWPGAADYLFFYSDTELYAPLLERGILIRRCDNYSGIPEEGYYRVAVRTHAENEELLREMVDIQGKEEEG